MEGEISQCPTLIVREYPEVFDGVAWLRQSPPVLPVAGGWLDQPAALMELIMIANSEIG